MIDVEGIYNQYLDHLNTEADKKYTKYKGWFRASSAGQCFRKQAYWLTDEKKKPFEVRVKRLLRLGQIIHSDFENSLNWYYKQLNDDSITLLTEHHIKLPKLNVIGSLDMAVIEGDIEKGTYSLYIHDLKSAASFKWRKQFGIKKNRDPDPPVNYELQLATYALGLSEELKAEPTNLYLTWYNKDNSSMKSVNIDLEYIDKAKEYWRNLITKLNIYSNNPEKIIPEKNNNVPVYPKWECKYCNFSEVCPSPYK
jgi:CRISPR/Cas system-associated exonuclease Cas4 (RecB family)